MYLNDLLYSTLLTLHTPSQDLKEVVDLLDSEEDPAIAAQEEARVQALLDSLDEKVVCCLYVCVRVCVWCDVWCVCVCVCVCVCAWL